MHGSLVRLRVVCAVSFGLLCLTVIFTPLPLFAAISATFSGPDADVVSETVLSPDGRADYKIKVIGLRSVPTQIQILSDTGGIWAVPFNGTNWVIALTNYNAGSGDLFFSQFPANQFTLQVVYADGSGEQTPVTNSPPPTSSLKATFLGIGPDSVSETAFSGDGRPDFNIKVDGLRAVPVEMQIISNTGGVWHTPFNGANWVIGLDNYSAGSANLHFAQFRSDSFKLQVAYADGTTDQTDVSNQPAPPSTLQAAFLGVGSDLVSETVLTPDGRSDFKIQVTGLRSVPTQIQILSDTGGIWKIPFNGVNWVIALANYNSGSGNLYFSQFKSNTFKVQVTYADGSTDQADAVNPTGNSVADVQRLLEQATFGPTSALTAAVQTSGIDSYLNQQFNAPMQDYPDLPFWPQTRPSTCILRDSHLVDR